MSSDGPPAYNLANHYAEDLRWAGRQLVLAKKYEEAMVKYTDAVTAFTRSGFEMGVGVCLTNRAIVAAKLGWWAESYCDAKLACSLFPRFFKARAARGRRARSRASRARSRASRARSHRALLSLRRGTAAASRSRRSASCALRASTTIGPSS